MEWKDFHLELVIITITNNTQFLKNKYSTFWIIEHFDNIIIQKSNIRLDMPFLMRWLVIFKKCMYVYYFF